MGLKQCICTTAQLTCKFQTYREAPLVLWSDSALEVEFKGTVTFTLQKMLLSTEQQEDPTYTCIQWAIHEQQSKWPQKGSFATSGKIREMLCVRRLFLKALQVPKWIQMDPYLLYEHFSKRKPQTEPRPKQLNNFVWCCPTPQCNRNCWGSFQPSHAHTDSHCHNRGCWIRILIHRQLLKTLGYFMIACSTNYPAPLVPSCTSFWWDLLLSIHWKVALILFFCTSPALAIPALWLYITLCYKKTQLSWVVMGREMKAIFQVITLEDLKYLEKILTLNSLRSQRAKLNSTAMNSTLFVLPRKRTAKFKNVFFRIKSFSCGYNEL